MGVVREKIQILLHLGYPKTASSSLQGGLFRALHESGHLNLITWRMHDAAEPFDRRPSSRLFLGLPMLDETLTFVPGVLNVLSDESFTAPLRLRRNNFGDGIKSPENFPSYIRAQIIEKYGSDVDIRCLLVLRNHADLIYSQYVEEYNLKKYRGVDLLFDSDGVIDLEGYEIYQFARYLGLLTDTFGEGSVTLMFFEELTASAKIFSRRLADVLSQPSAKVQALLESVNRNSKEKNRIGYMTSDGQRTIPFLDSLQKSTITRFFEDDTLRLGQLVSGGVDLKKWGYL